MGNLFILIKLIHMSEPAATGTEPAAATGTEPAAATGTEPAKTDETKTTEGTKDAPKIDLAALEK